MILDTAPQTRAIAPPMPMTLIEPVASSNAGETDGAAATWGIQAVGATTTRFGGTDITVAVRDTGIDPTHPSPWASIFQDRPNFEIAVAPLAAGTGIVSVGAIENGDEGLSIACFSNNQVDISAPGTSVLSAVPRRWVGVKKVVPVWLLLTWQALPPFDHIPSYTEMSDAPKAGLRVNTSLSIGRKKDKGSLS